MSRTVFILGAGASRQTGAPLMKDFLDLAEGLLVRNEVQDSAGEFRLVFKGLNALSHAHSKATLDVINIESVFAAFEMAKLLGRLGSLNSQEIDRMPDAMRRVIVRTLEKDSSPKTPIPYGHLSDFITRVRDKGGLTACSIITFHYDLCIDLALFLGNMHVRYCLGHAENDTGVALLKLHGSLSWGHCSVCNQLVAWPLPNYLHNRYWSTFDGRDGILEMSLHMSGFQHCKAAVFKGPYVVPPTWNKGQYHSELESVWKAAASELSTAENIIVSGYSLPDSDQFFRYLYALGTVGDLRLKNLWVFDPDPAVEGRFRALLGQAVEPRFKFFAEKFGGMFAHLNPLLK